MLPLTRHKTPIPHTLAAISAVLCLALTFAPAPRGDEAATLHIAGTQVMDTGLAPADAEPGSDGPARSEAERERRADSVRELRLPNFTFFLFPQQQ